MFDNKSFRGVRTIRLKAGRILSSKRITDFVTAAKLAAKLHNESPSRALNGLTPIEAGLPKNASKVLDFKRGKHFLKLEKLADIESKRKKKSGPKEETEIRVGTKVRILESKGQFDKEAAPSYTAQIYEVRKILPNSSVKLAELFGEKWEKPGTYTLSDLLPVKDSAFESEKRVNKVVRKLPNSHRIVNFQGYPEDYREEVEEEELEKLRRPYGQLSSGNP